MPKLGEALKAVVKEDEDTLEVKGRPESVLMNPTRQKIFEFLCHQPATRLRPMARKLDMSATVLQFHLRKMTTYEYVATVKTESGTLYYPTDLRPTDDDISTLAILADDFGREMLKRVVEKQGLTPAELAHEIGRSIVVTRKMVASMETQGLLAVIMDGRHNRLFPGDKLSKLEKRTRQLLRGMKSRLIRRFSRDRLRPEVEMDSRRESTIILHVGNRKYRIRLPSDTLLPWLSHR